MFYVAGDKQCKPRPEEQSDLGLQCFSDIAVLLFRLIMVCAATANVDTATVRMKLVQLICIAVWDR